MRASSQGGQSGPPQSLSLSLPLRMPSAQLGAEQLPSELHSLLRQSLSTRQCLPVLHVVQTRPPQSTSVSSPLTTLSPQVGKTGAFLLQAISKSAAASR